MNYFDHDVADRVPYMIRTLVYIWAVLVTIAVILINRRPKDHLELQRKYQLTSQSNEQDNTSEPSEKKINSSNLGYNDNQGPT